MLASTSPRRAALLRAAGYRFKVRAPEVTERQRRGESASRLARRLAMEKARDVARRLRQGIALGADTVVVIDGAVLGKPANAASARRMLRRLSGRSHRVITAVALCRAGGKAIGSASVVTTVKFKRLSAEEIEWYVGTGEPMDKAGGYGIQGRGGLFVSSIRGSYSNVVGLPIETVHGFLGSPA